MRTWFGVWVVVAGSLCWASLNSKFFPLIVAVSFISSGALIVAAVKTGGSGIKRYPLITGIVVFILTALVSMLKMSITQ